MTDRRDRDDQLHALGAFIRAQRQLANLSLRQMADLAQVSNPYLSQLERGLHEPSVRVLQSVARALNVSAETLLAHAGIDDETVESELPDTETAIRSDARLTDDQKQALLSVYRSYVQANTSATGTASRSAPHVLARGRARPAGAGRCPIAGGARSSPARSASQRLQSFHQVSRCSVAPACHAAGVARQLVVGPEPHLRPRRAHDARRCGRPTSSRSASDP